MLTAEKTGQPVKESVTRKPHYSNPLFATDCVTEGHAYINSVRIVPIQPEGELVFVNLGLQCGSSPASNGEGYEPIYQNLDVLVGSTLARSMRLLEGDYTKGTGKLYGRVQIRNLTFQASPSQTDDRIFLNSRGILETLQLGFLDV